MFETRRLLHELGFGSGISTWIVGLRTSLSISFAFPTTFRLRFGFRFPLRFRLGFRRGFDLLSGGHEETLAVWSNGTLFTKASLEDRRRDARCWWVRTVDLKLRLIWNVYIWKASNGNNRDPTLDNEITWSCTQGLQYIDAMLQARVWASTRSFFRRTPIKNI